MNKNNLNFFKTSKQIDNINSINYEIKEKILSNENLFILENNNYISIISLKKNIQSHEGLIAEIYTVKSKKKINDRNITCDKILKLDTDSHEINIKQYEYLKLNKQIKENLITINDFLLFSNDEIYTYIMLCNLKFNKDILSKIDFNKQLSYSVNDFEDKFIKKYSKIFNLNINNE